MTIDELASRVYVLEGEVNQLHTNVNSLNTNVHNIDTRMDSAEEELRSHARELEEHQSMLEDHEARLKTIEDSSISYSVVRRVKYPKKTDQGFLLYVPEDLTIDTLMQYNQEPIKEQKWNWFNKIFNRQSPGTVSFDLYKGEEQNIKSIVMGPNTRLIIPTGIIFDMVTPYKSVLKVANQTTQSIEKGLAYGIEILQSETGEAMVSVFNPTFAPVTLKADQVLVQVLHLFSYHTTPKLT